MRKLVLWTPGLTALHRVLTAALLALVPPNDGVGFQLAYWLLLALHAFGWLAPLPLLTAWAGSFALAYLGKLGFADSVVLLAPVALAWCGAWLAHSKAAAFERIQLCLLSVIILLWGIDFTYEGKDRPYLLVLAAVWFMLSLFTSLRWLAWIGLLLNVGVLYILDFVIEPELLIFYALALSPAWIPRRRAGLPLTVFYDGECGFCHRSVQFLMKEDPAGAALRFAPLQGTTFAALVPESARAALPDSIVVRDADGTLYVRSAGALRAGAALGGYWRPLAVLGRLVPRPLRDAAYDAIARRRKRWFTKPDAHCPLLSPAERARFDP